MEKTNLEKAHDKARLLLVRSVDTSSTENERTAAAAALARLCKKYGLNANKLRTPTDPEELSVGKFYASVNKTGRMCHWASQLGIACSAMYGGSSVVSCYKGMYLRIEFIGTEAQQESALHLYEFLVKEMNRLCKEAAKHKPNPRSFGNSFRVAFAVAVLRRVRAINEQRKKDEEALEATGLRLYDRGVEDFVKSLKFSKVKEKPKLSNTAGFLSGDEAGNGVRLGDSLSTPALT